MEALYREVTAKRELERSFEDMVREIHHLIGQMDDEERRTYLTESLSSRGCQIARNCAPHFARNRDPSWA